MAHSGLPGKRGTFGSTRDFPASALGASATASAALVPDFVICGNVVRDLTPGGWLPGGTAVYAAAVARGLGLSVGVVTAAPVDVVAAGLAPDVAVARADVPEATVYENVYTPAGRIQYLRAAGSPIPAALVPEAWTAAPLTLLGPVYHEVGPELAACFHGSVGVCLQGFLRHAGPDDRISLLPPSSWDALPVLRHARVLFLSEEDLAGSEERRVPAAWLEAVPITVVTAGPSGAHIHSEGRWWEVPASPAREVDPTGAGDSFAAGFMIALHEGASPPDAARFATAVAAFVVEGPGPQAPSREDVMRRLEGQALTPDPSLFPTVGPPAAAGPGPLTGRGEEVAERDSSFRRLSTPLESAHADSGPPSPRVGRGGQGVRAVPPAADSASSEAHP